MGSGGGGVLLEVGGGKEGMERESSTPENSTNKPFQVLTLQKAHEPPEIRAILTRKIA